MTSFADWFAEMQDMQRIGTRKADQPKRKAAELLGVTDDTITNLLNERVPFDRRTRLACRALLCKLKEY